MSRWFATKHDPPRKPCQWEGCHWPVSQPGQRYCHHHQERLSTSMELEGYLEIVPDLTRQSDRMLPRCPHVGEDPSNIQEGAQRIREDNL